MIKNELKNKFFILLSRCVEGIFTSTLFTPLLTGFGGILLNTNLYFRYKHNFNVWNEFFFASKGVALGVIFGMSGCILFLFRGNRTVGSISEA